jgi:endonuclease III
VGPKTIEFLKLLVGLEAVAIDVHVLRATKAAGVREKDPVKLAVLFATAAKICGRRLSEIDGAIWNERASKAEQ